jgi:hypothetical protein
MKMSVRIKKSMVLKALAPAAIAVATVGVVPSEARAASGPAFSLAKPVNAPSWNCSWEWMGTINNGCGQEVTYEFPVLNSNAGEINVDVTGYSNGPSNLVYCQILTLDPNRDYTWGPQYPIPANSGVGSPYNRITVSGPVLSGGVGFVDCYVPNGDGINQFFW